MPEDELSFRIDFIMVNSKITEGGKISGYMIPDPERYEWITRDGKKFLRDKFDNLLIPEAEFASAAAKSARLPIHYSPPDIKNTDEYLASRKPKIAAFLDSGESHYEFADKSEEFLSGLEKDKLKFVILCIDIVGSTKLSKKLGLEKFTKIIQLFSREMAAIVALHRGYVLKYTGDELIAYFPEPNFIGMNDNAVDCGITMKLMVERLIAPMLVARGEPSISFRIGIDSGSGAIATIGARGIKQHKDIIGLTVNFAAKMQAVALPGGIVIGNATARNLHSSRRKHFEKFEVKDWSYGYPLHRLKT